MKDPNAPILLTTPEGQAEFKDLLVQELGDMLLELGQQQREREQQLSDRILAQPDSPPLTSTDPVENLLLQLMSPRLERARRLLERIAVDRLQNSAPPATAPSTSPNAAPKSVPATPRKTRPSPTTTTRSTTTKTLRLKRRK